MTLTPKQIAAFDPQAHVRCIRKDCGKVLSECRCGPYQRPYLETSWRLVWLRDKYPPESMSLETAIEAWEPAIVVKATATFPVSGHQDNEIRVSAFGSATPEKGKVYSGREVEKAETAAIGRLCARLGFGTQFTGEDDAEHLADAPGGDATPAPRPASPPRQAPPMQPTAPLRASADDILGIAKLLHQVDEGVAEDFCQDYDIPIETRADGRHYKKGLTEASLREVNELTRDAADILKHLLLPHVKKMAKGVPEQGITQVSSSALPLPEDIKTVGDLLDAAWKHFKLQRGEIFAILGVEKAEQIHDCGAAWKIVVAAKKQGALV